MKKQTTIPRRRIRLLHYVIDYGTILFISYIILMVYWLSTGLGADDLSFYFIYIIVEFGYYLVLEGLFQRTLGKLVTGYKVVNDEGLKPSFKQLLIRSWIRTIFIDVISFLHSRVGHHDLLSDTRLQKMS